MQICAGAANGLVMTAQSKQVIATINQVVATISLTILIIDVFGVIGNICYIFINANFIIYFAIDN